MANESGCVSQQDRFQTALLELAQEIGKYFQDDSLTVLHRGCMAVVQQQNVRRLQSVAEPPKNALGIRRDGVETTARPTDQSQIKFLKHRVKQWISKSGRCPEKKWQGSCSVAYRGLRTIDFFSQATRTHQRKVVTMRMTVIFYCMAASDDLPGQRRIPLDSLTNAKKGCLGIRRFKNVKSCWCHPRIGAIIDRDCNLSGLPGGI